MRLGKRDKRDPVLYAAVSVSAAALAAALYLAWETPGGGPLRAFMMAAAAAAIVAAVRCRIKTYADQDSARLAQRLYELFEGLPLSIQLFDEDDRLVLMARHMNPEFTDIWRPGVQFSDAVRLAVERGLVLEAVGREEAWIAERIEKHRNPSGEFELQVAEDRWFIVNEYRTREGGTAVIRTNITEAKQREAALHQARETLHGVIDAAPVTISAKDAQGRYIFMNRHQAEFCGIEADHVVGKTATEVYHPAGDECAIDGERDKEIFASGVSMPFFEETYFDQAGAATTWLTTKSPLRDAYGDISYVVTISLNVTDSKRAEDALRQSEARLARAHSLARLGHWWLETDVYRLRGSKEMCDIFGVDEFYVTYDEFMEIVHPDDQQIEELIFGEGKHFAGGHEIEYRIIRPDGELRHILEIGEPLFGDDGEIIGETGTVQDITERKAAEDALRETQEQLLEAQKIGRIGNFIWDEIEDRQIYASDVLMEILGFDPSSPLPSMEGLIDRVHMADRALFRRNARKINVAHKSADFEYRLRQADGSVRYIHERCDPVFDEAGRRIRSVGIIQDITERKLGEIALHESNARLRSFFDNAPSTISAKDMDGRFTLANQSFSNLVGKTAAEIIGKKSSDLFPPKISDSMERLDKQVAAGGGIVDWEHDILVDGVLRVLNLVKFPVRDGVGNIIAIGSSSTDITERKRNEEFLRTIVDSMPLVLTITDVEGRYVLSNKRLLDYYGFEASDMIGKLPADIFQPSPSDAQETEEIEKVIETGVPIRDSEYKYLADGGVEYWLTSREPIFDTAGNLQFILTVSSDITAKKQVENDLLASEARLLEAQRISKLGHWEWNLDDDQMYMSSEIARLLGPGPSDVFISYDDYRVHVHPDDRDGFEREMERFRAGLEPYDIEYRIVLNNGDVRYVNEKGEYKHDDIGKARKAFGMIHDVTEIKQAEVATIAAKEQAELSNRAKSEFLANMSHDLRTPLNAVIGFSDMMKAEILGPVGVPKYREYIDAINDSGVHLLQMINDILDISKIEASNIELHEDEVDVEQVIDAVLTLLTIRAESGQVKLVKVNSAGLPRLFADEGRLKQILANLLSNAVKFTPPGGVVHVTAECGDDGGLRVAVCDTGIGIAEEDIARVLEPFGQVDSALNRKYEGTGLGLPLVNAMVRQHGGTFHIDSEIGVGTTVSVTFPAERVVKSLTRTYQ